MIRRLLIANRGEIACRVIRTAERLGIETVAVYSAADADALHVRMADRSLHIGPAPAQDSYLNIDAIVAAARAAGADAVHPGYGFLAENARFAEACTAAGCLFVGPPAAAIRAMGSKAAAKRIAADAGLAVVPGYHGDEQGAERLEQEARCLGFPLLVKPSAGGGGKGMRRVDSADDLAAALDSARREARAAFGDDTLLLERYLDRPKHIEVQVFADDHGQVVHLFERDCSVQRRHQKIIEEAPAPVLDPAMRQRLGDAACALARAIDYRGAGTVEFIGSAQEFFFMEMNTRLQVEHPVTESITGLDLVEWQLRVAAGEALPWRQAELAIAGHAIEARIYAEAPHNQFLPSTGHVVHLSFPRGVRVDAGIDAASVVGAHYDPMLAKVIAHAPDRRQAIAALDRALSATELAGVTHNIAFLRRVLADADFVSGTYDIGLIERSGDVLVRDGDARTLCAVALALITVNGVSSPWERCDAFRINLPWMQTLRLSQRGREVELHCRIADGVCAVSVDGSKFSARDVRFTNGVIEAQIDDQYYAARIVVSGRDLYCIRGGATVQATLLEDDPASFERDVKSDGRITAPMPGQVLAINVKAGDSVQVDAPLLVLEAMKMEHTIVAPAHGVVETVAVAVGARVEEGAELIVIQVSAP
jgi:3-methylcrotonyl-CoA carboxylase alpha subunit